MNSEYKRIAQTLSSENLSLVGVFPVHSCFKTGAPSFSSPRPHYHLLSTEGGSCWQRRQVPLRISLHSLFGLHLWDRPIPSLNENCTAFSGYVTPKLQWKITLWWFTQSKKITYKLHHTFPVNYTVLAGREFITSSKRSMGRSTYLVKNKRCPGSAEHSPVDSALQFRSCCLWSSNSTRHSLGPLWPKSDQKFSHSGLMIRDESRKQLKE